MVSNVVSCIMRSTSGIYFLTLNFLLYVRQYVVSYNILGVFPFPARSHYNVFDSLMVELAARGHNVTVYDHFPKSYSLPNYGQVDLRNCFSLPNLLSLDQMFSLGARRMQASALLAPFMPSEREILDCQPLRDLQKSRQPYDLLITETFHNDFFALFGHALNVPVIVFQTCAVAPWMSLPAGLPDNPSYLRHLHIKHFDRKNFWNRVENLILYLHSLYFYKFESEYVYDGVAAKFFGSGTPTVGEAIKNASMLFVNTHYSYHGARPMVPNVVDVGGINIRPAKALPKDIEKFINDSAHGVIYFSLGSILLGRTFPEEKRNAFLYAFSKLPQRVLWKWEEDTLPGKSDNIMILKWMPQRDIFAHPNIKLFISHGGFLGTNEAVYEGVPVLAIPMYGDQPTNIESIAANGAGETLDYTDISAEVVYEKVSRLLNDSKFKRNAVDMSARYRDRPMSPLDTAVYWTEYVIRHKGAPHLKTAVVHMPWHQYFLLDVIAFSLLVVVGAFSIVYFLAKLMFGLMVSWYQNKTSSKFEKKVKKS